MIRRPPRSTQSRSSAASDVYKRQVQYVEAHGTGTFVGDPIETNSIGKVIGTDRTTNCFIGSIKSNIGHLEPASGVAGISKLLLALKHKTIPPNIHFKNGNRNIPFEDLKLDVPVDTHPWPAKTSEECFAGINSFGFGGSNVHVVLQGHKQNDQKQKSTDKKGLQVCTLSTRNSDALLELTQTYIDWLKDKKNTATLS